ncbi:T6SS immunity protein Tli4 family protein [Luteimonas sp. A537]
MKSLPSRTHRMLLLCVLVLSSCTTGNAEGNQMSGTMDGTRTHCLGRYLVGLPADGSISAKYIYGGGEITTKRGVTHESFAEILNARESVLRSVDHRSDGKLFVERVDFYPTQVLLRSWSSPSSRELQLNELFVQDQSTRVMFSRKGESGAQYRDRAVDLQGTIASAIRYRAPTEIPTTPGFCIDSGLIARSNLNKEEFTASIRLKAYPSVTVTLMSYVTGRPDEELLKRIGRIPPGYEEAASRMKSLRRDDRNIGPVTGQELLVRGDAEGKRSYEFLWEAQGRANSLEFPFMSLELSTTDQTDEDGEIIDAPFKTDEEALRVWDAILDTLRLRPGAV